MCMLEALLSSSSSSSSNNIHKRNEIHRLTIPPHYNRQTERERERSSKPSSASTSLRSSSLLLSKANHIGRRKRITNDMDFFVKLFSSSATSSSWTPPSSSSSSSSSSPPPGYIIPDALRNIQKRYSFHPQGAILGQGSFGVVRKCRDKTTKEWFACKSIAKKQQNENNVSSSASAELIQTIQREVANIRAVQYRPSSSSAPATSSHNHSTTSKENRRREPHPHIVEVIDVYEDDKYVHIITELCSGGELYDQILEWKKKKEQHQQQQQQQQQQTPQSFVDETKAAVILLGILQALSYLHDTHHIAHRDLKASNFLFWKQGSLHVKIIDFGLSIHVPVPNPPPSPSATPSTNTTPMTSNNKRLDQTRMERPLGSNEDDHHEITMEEQDDDDDDEVVDLVDCLPSSYSKDDSDRFISANSTPIPSTRTATASEEEEEDEDDEEEKDAAIRQGRRSRNTISFTSSTRMASFATAHSSMSDGEIEIMAASPFSSPRSSSTCCLPPDNHHDHDHDHDDDVVRRSLYGTMTSEVGTPYYVAPEVLLQDEYTCLCDVWSIGVIAFLILSCGTLPFQGADERETIRLLMNHEHIDFPPAQWANISPQAQDFCRQLLQKDPSRRPTARQALSHPWLLQHCGAELQEERTTTTSQK